MNATTKNLVRGSLEEFRASKTHEKEEMISELREKLKAHENSLKTIGVGYNANHVQGARIFLRILKNTEVRNV